MCALRRLLAGTHIQANRSLLQSRHSMTPRQQQQQQQPMQQRPPAGHEQRRQHVKARMARLLVVPPLALVVFLAALVSAPVAVQGWMPLPLTGPTPATTTTTMMMSASSAAGSPR